MPEALAQSPQSSESFDEVAAALAGGTLASGVAGAAPVAGATTAGVLSAAAAAAIGKAVAAKMLDWASLRWNVMFDPSGPIVSRVLEEYPEKSAEDVLAVLERRERGFEREFRRKMRKRLLEDVPLALSHVDPATRAERLKAIFRRELRYTAMREEAMLSRSMGALEAEMLEQLSPEGAYWKLSPHVKQHTMDCLAMGEKFWPWSVLRKVQPPLHYGCPCYLLGLDEAIGEGLMTADQVPDEKDARDRYSQLADQVDDLRHLDEAEVEELYSLALEEASVRQTLRWAKGFVKGGQFRPKRGGFSDRIRSPFSLPESPTRKRGEGRGRWTWVGGRYTKIPEADGWTRTIGSRVYHSPPGGTNVYLNGNILNRPGDVSPPSERLRSPGTVEISPELAAKVDAARTKLRANDHSHDFPPITRGDGVSAVLALEDAGYSLQDAQRTGDASMLTYRHADGTLTVEVSDREGVKEVGWTPNAPVHAPIIPPPSVVRSFPVEPKPEVEVVPLKPRSRRALTAPAERWEDHCADALAFADELGEKYGAEVYAVSFRTDQDLSDHAGTHHWDGSIRVGNMAPRDIERAARARARGVPLTDREKQGVYASYWVTGHEVAHAINPIGPTLFNDDAHANLEEALAEEMGHRLALDRLARHGQYDVIEWRWQNPDALCVRGVYPNERYALQTLLDEAGVPIVDRYDVIQNLCFRIAPEQRISYLATLHAANNGGDVEASRRHVERVLRKPRRAPDDFHGVINPSAQRILGARQFGKWEGGELSEDGRVLTLPDGRRRVIERFRMEHPEIFSDEIRAKLAASDGTMVGITNYPPGVPITDGPLFADGTPKNFPEFRPVDDEDRALLMLRGWIGKNSPGVWEADPDAWDQATLAIENGEGALVVGDGVPVVKYGDGSFGVGVPHGDSNGDLVWAPDARTAAEIALMRSDYAATHAGDYKLRRSTGVGPENLRRVGADDLVDGRAIYNKWPTHESGPEYARQMEREGNLWVPNEDSIIGIADDYRELGIREVPMNLVVGDEAPPPRLDPKTEELRQAIGENNAIAPLIVVWDDEGPWVLEGSHRYDALRAMGAKSFPALVVDARTPPPQSPGWWPFDVTPKKGKGKKKKKPKPPKPQVIGGKKNTPLDNGTPYPDYDGVRLTLGNGAGGSNGARWAFDDEGNRWLVKTYRGNEDRIATELVANRIYDVMGARVARAGMIEVDGKTALTYQALDGKPIDRVFAKRGPSAEVGEHYMVDALLANWDFAGMTDDNILWDADGNPIRVDQGGTLEYRAMGQTKPFGPIPTDVWTMIRKGQAKRASLVTEDQMREQAGEVAARLTPDVIDDLMDTAPFQDQEMRERVREALKARVEWMGAYSRGEVDVPQVPEGKTARSTLADAQAEGKFEVFPEEIPALEFYANGGDFEVQKHLRSRAPKEAASEPVQNAVSTLDNILRDAKTPEDLYVYVRVDDVEAAKALTGKTVEERGFLHGTTDKALASSGGGYIRVLVPEGSRAVNLADLDAPKNSPEIVMPRGSRLKVTSVRDEDGKTVVEATLMRPAYRPPKPLGTPSGGKTGKPKPPGQIVIPVASEDDFEDGPSSGWLTNDAEFEAWLNAQDKPDSPQSPGTMAPEFSLSNVEDPRGDAVESGTVWIIARDGDEVVGGLQWDYTGNVPVVLDMWIDPDYRGTGLAQQLGHEAQRNAKILRKLRYGVKKKSSPGTETDVAPPQSPGTPEGREAALTMTPQEATERLEARGIKVGKPNLNEAVIDAETPFLGVIAYLAEQFPEADDLREVTFASSRALAQSHIEGGAYSGAIADKIARTAAGGDWAAMIVHAGAWDNEELDDRENFKSKMVLNDLSRKGTGDYLDDYPEGAKVKTLGAIWQHEGDVWVSDDGRRLTSQELHKETNAGFTVGSDRETLAEVQESHAVHEFGHVLAFSLSGPGDLELLIPEQRFLSATQAESIRDGLRYGPLGGSLWEPMSYGILWTLTNQIKDLTGGKDVGWKVFENAGISMDEIASVSKYAASEPGEAFSELFAAHYLGLLADDLDAKFTALLDTMRGQT